MEKSVTWDTKETQIFPLIFHESFYHKMENKKVQNNFNKIIKNWKNVVKPRFIK